MPAIESIFSAETCQARYQQIDRFWQGEGRYLISIFPEQSQYRRTADLELMVTKATAHLADLGRQSPLAMPELWTDWGTVSTARYWGGQVQLEDQDNSLLYIHPRAQTIAEALELSPAAVDHPLQDGARTIQFFRRMQTDFPGIDFWLHTLDMQGVLSTAGMVLKQEAMLIAMLEEPRQTHQFLQRVTAFLIELNQYLREATGGRVCGNLWPYCFFPQSLGIMIVEDMLPLLSPRLYNEFGIPYLKQINDTFGGLAIHCCGKYRQHLPALANSGLTIRALEFWYPFMSWEQLRPLAETTVFVPYILLDCQHRFHSQAEYYRYLIEEADPHFRFWFALTDDPQLKAFISEYGPSR